LTKRIAAALFACGVICAATASADDGPGLYLHVTQIESIEAAEGESPSLRVFVKDPDASVLTLTQKGLEIIEQDSESFTLALPNEHPTLNGVPDKLIEDTFVIDYKEPSVVEMIAAQPWSSDEGLVSVETLTRSVYDWIEDKTYARAFDFASTVAKTRSGDCTEHAVLLAATARATGRPARVVFGFLIVQGEATQAFLHAWTDVWEDGSWHVSDATMPELFAADARVRYVPIDTLENESPSYMMGMLTATSNLASRLELRD
jgi:hypothetical protein